MGVSSHGMNDVAEVNWGQMIVVGSLIAGAIWGLCQLDNKKDMTDKKTQPQTEKNISVPAVKPKIT